MANIMRGVLRVGLLVCVGGLATGDAWAAKTDKKDRLVLMPLQTLDVDRALVGTMEAAVVKGLQGRYTVFSGEQVQKKVKEVFEKESKTAKKSCDETKCIQDIAIAFQAELIAVANVTKRSGGYFLTLSIRNITSDEAVYSESQTCKSCDEFQVVDALKTLAGGGAVVAEGAGATAAPASSAALLPAAPVAGGGFSLGALDQQAKAEEGVKKKWTNYLAEMKNAYAQVQAYEQRDISDKLKLQAWEKFQADYPQDDPYSVEDETMRSQAQARIAALKAMVEATVSNTASVGSGKSFSDCAKCPEMVKLPGQTLALGKYEVTQRQWRFVMGENSGKFLDCGDTCPVQMVSWNDVQEFIKKLNSKTGKTYRLPTEAEWELACHAGQQQEYCGSEDADDVSWYDGNSGDKVHPAGQKKPNAWGLYDMSGNVWEWTADCDGSSCFRRVYRGGSWSSNVEDVRMKAVNKAMPFYYDTSIGFRLARTLD